MMTRFTNIWEADHITVCRKHLAKVFACCNILECLASASFAQNVGDIGMVKSFRPDICYTNYSTTQSAMQFSGADTGYSEVRNVSQSASVTLSVLYISRETANSFIDSVSQQQYTHCDIYTQASAYSRTTAGPFNYSLSFLKTSLNIGAPVLYAHKVQITATSSLSGMTIYVSRTFFRNKLSVGGSFGFTESKMQLLDCAMNTFDESINSSFRIFPQGTLSFTLKGRETSSTSGGAGQSVEIIATFSYSHNFSF